MLQVEKDKRITAEESLKILKSAKELLGECLSICARNLELPLLSRLRGTPATSNDNLEKKKESEIKNLLKDTCFLPIFRGLSHLKASDLENDKTASSFCYECAHQTCVIVEELGFEVGNIPRN